MKNPPDSYWGYEVDDDCYYENLLVDWLLLLFEDFSTIVGVYYLSDDDFY